MAAKKGHRRYIQVIRILQSTYWLEPAGSHGVWGLDDYHFLPFLFGSAQLRGTLISCFHLGLGPLVPVDVDWPFSGHKYLCPKAMHGNEVVVELANDYVLCLYQVSIVSIYMKRASLRWHSPMLDNISAVNTWDKVNAGMMYKAEVLGKAPVTQHSFFGSTLPY
ncbi:putative serine/threonine-protein phosphatase 2A activator 2-like protein [Pisolithus albus]|nr:putative serine/threonine-protein phosphatase 2A activator 2-like protein [Pisolithus albus]